MSPNPLALVTGASRGLGLALAQGLHAHGWRLLVDGRDADALARASDALGTDPPVQVVAGDVADPAHRSQLAAEAHRLGRVDLLVLNAGTLGPSPLPALDRLDLDDLRRTLDVNLVAQLGVVQALGPNLNPGATVVAVTSDAAVEPYEGWGAYAASKAGLEQLMAVLNVEHPELRVLIVDPGDMRTQMHQEAFPGEDISDRPPPEASVPGILALLERGYPSGRYQAASVPTAAGATH